MGRKRRSTQQMIVQSLCGVGHIFTPAILVAEFLERTFRSWGRFYYNIQEQGILFLKMNKMSLIRIQMKSDYPGFDIVTSDDSVYVA